MRQRVRVRESKKASKREKELFESVIIYKKSPLLSDQCVPNRLRDAGCCAAIGARKLIYMKYAK